MDAFSEMWNVIHTNKIPLRHTTEEEANFYWVFNSIGILLSYCQGLSFRLMEKN